MAKYLAGGRVRGTLHGVTYQRNLYTGWVAKEKSSITAEQIATSPAFQRTRENNNEMKGVGAYVKELRHSLDLFLPYVSDPIVTGRLIRSVKAIQLKSPGVRGQRPIVGGNIANGLAAEGFEVSEPYPLSRTARAFSVTIGARSVVEGETRQMLTFAADSVEFPTGANAALPIVTIIECDELEYADGNYNWFNPRTPADIKRHVMSDFVVLRDRPTTEYEIIFPDDSSALVAQDWNSVGNFNFGSALAIPPYEFGRNLVWFGLQFGQLVDESTQDANIFRFYPLRGATAGKAVATLDPIQP